MTEPRPPALAVGSAAAALASRQLDLFRGMAAIFMIVNHSGYQLLHEDASAGGWPTWLVFIGSAAPALFFFATGVGIGFSQSSRESAASAIRKVVLLLLADMLLNWSNGTFLGFDFFGFAAVATATLWLVRRASRPVLVCVALLVLVLVLRFGLATAIRGWVVDDPLLAFVTGIVPVRHVSYPLGPWLAFPLLGFLVGKRWCEGGSAAERWVIGLAAVACIALSAALAVHGATVFRWGSVSIAYFLCAVGIVAAAWLCAERVVEALPVSARAMSLRGPASLLIVPLHYGILGLLEWLSPSPWSSAAWALTTIALVLIVFMLSRALISNARRLAVPSFVTQAMIAAVACAAAWVAWRFGDRLQRLEVCSAAEVVVAMLLLWSSNKTVRRRPREIG